MIRTLLTPAAIALLLLATGCGRSRDEPVTASVIGATPEMANPDRVPMRPEDAVLVAATAQGLVRFDASGQIEPGLSIRWAISDDGLYYTFRLGKFAGIDAEYVARQLRNRIRRSSHNPFRPLLGAVREVIAVTPEVVEIRLNAPRANLLDLLAQPEMSIVGRKGGTGPLMLESTEHGLLTLAPPPDPDAAEAPDPADLRRRHVLLRGERASRAIARFAAGQSDLVLGGRYLDLPLARAAKPRRHELRFDPVSGLFGFVIVERQGFLGQAENRRALAMAIDRSRIASGFGLPDWQISHTILAPGAPDLPEPTQPGWIDAGLALRRTVAADVVQFWKKANPDTPIRLRVALPRGPGSRLLFAYLRADWRTIGVEAVRVGAKDDADLRLIDEVAPSQSASWYLRRFSCDRSRVCSEAADTMLEAAREAASPVDRSARLADAELRLIDVVPFIPIAQPLRWSLVNGRLVGFQTNIRGVHPLNHLLAAQD